MTSIFAALFILMPIVFFYSSTVEQNRIITISRPLVITQERKSPAYYLYQQTQKIEEPQIEKPVSTTLLTTEGVEVKNENTLATVGVSEMVFTRKELAKYLEQVEQQNRKVLVQSGQPATLDELKNKSQEAVTNYASSEQAVTQAVQPADSFENNAPSSAMKWATLRGKFELRDGVGVVDHIIELTRIEEGMIREKGQVDLKAGLYSIDVASPKGYLLAEIKDRNGSVIGEDRQKIINLQSRGPFLEGPFIQVRHPATADVNPDVPYRTTAAGHPAVSLAKTNKKPTSSPNTAAFSATLFSFQSKLEEPHDEFRQIAFHSSTVAHLEDENGLYKSIVTIRQPGQKNKTPVFTKKWTEGLLEYISDQQQIELKSKQAPLIIGQVIVDGKPIAGAQVQIEGHPGLTPLYFDNFMIPSFKQTETSANGYFVFIGLEEELYAVTAIYKNQIIGHQSFVGETQMIGFQTIESATASTLVVVRAFDAFNGQPIETEYIAPDVETVLQTEGGVGQYRTKSVLGLTEYLVNPADSAYMPLRYIQDARKDYTHIPMIHESWLKQLQASRLINKKPNTGSIICFIPDMDYDAYLILDEYTQDNMVYFDAQGRPSSQPLRGGGFVLFNVPTGKQEVVAQQKNSDRVYSQVFNVVSDQISLTHLK